MKKAIIDQDAELVSRCKSGDQDAFRQLFEAYYPKIRGFARKFLGDDHYAEDVVQDVFLQVHRKLALFRGDAKFSTWLFRVSLNACKSKLHKLQRVRRFDPEEYMLDRRMVEDRGPVRQLGREELRGQIQDSLDALPDEHRRIIVMKTVRELSYQEIGEATNQSEAQVRGKLYRARKAFRATIEPHVGQRATAA